MAQSRKWKWLLMLVPVVLLLVFGGYEGIRVWWYRAYTTGMHTGVVHKISTRGPPYCKYLSGELVVQSADLVTPEIWEFSVDDDAELNPVVVALHDAEKKGDRVTVRYRQDLHSLFRCTPSEYFVTKVER